MLKKEIKELKLQKSPIVTKPKRQTKKTKEIDV